jgi:hypothetical protein
MNQMNALKQIREHMATIEYGIMKEVYDRFKVPYTFDDDGKPWIDYDKWMLPKTDHKSTIKIMEDIANRIYREARKNIRHHQVVQCHDGVLTMVVQQKDGGYKEVFRY